MTYFESMNLPIRHVMARRSTASLNKAGKRRFLTRVQHFIEVKTFKYIDVEPDERMPLLIGAAAVQLTYELDHYLLDYFGT